MNLLGYKKLCDALVKLMHPLVEVVIHDIASKKICHISGSLSGRSVGDDSLLDIDIGIDNNTNVKDELENTSAGGQGGTFEEQVYTKINYNGKLIKSISIMISPEYMICINSDISVFHEMKKISALLTLSGNIRHEKLFRNDWKERINWHINSFVRDKGWDFQNLKYKQKKEILHSLFNVGTFEEHNASDYISDVLRISRSTIFSYLKEWRSA